MRLFLKCSIGLLLVIFSCRQPTGNIYTNGTCIVVARSQSGICVAADSRRVVSMAQRGSQFSVLRYDTVCKIHQVGHLFYASAGTNTDPLDSIAESCISDTGNIVNLARDFISKAILYRAITLEKTRVNSPAEYEHYYKDLKNVGICFFGFENNFPKIIDVSLIINSKPYEKVLIKDSTNYYLEPPITNTFVLLGHTDSIYNVLRADRFWKGQSFEDGMRKLVSIECDIDSIDVARPITVLAILSEKKFYWSKGSPCIFK